MINCYPVGRSCNLFGCVICETFSYFSNRFDHLFLKKELLGNYLINLLFEATLSSVLHLSLIGGNLKERWSLFSHMPTHTHTTTHGLHTDRSKSTDSRIYTSRTKLTLKRIFPQETENAQW